MAGRFVIEDDETSTPAPAPKASGRFVIEDDAPETRPEVRTDTRPEPVAAPQPPVSRRQKMIQQSIIPGATPGAEDVNLTGMQSAQDTAQAPRIPAALPTYEQPGVLEAQFAAAPVIDKLEMASRRVMGSTTQPLSRVRQALSESQRLLAVAPNIKTDREMTLENAARIRGTNKDIAIGITKGVVGVGESAVGIADIFTGNLSGKALAAVGYDPEATERILTSGYSPERQEANERVQAAKGFLNTVGALVDNPSVAFGSIIESAPMSLGSAGVARALATRLLAKAGIKAGTTTATQFFLNPKIQTALIAAASGTEGAMTAGQIQEQGRQGGRDWSDTVLPAVGAGLGTAAIGFGTSKLPGFKDAEVSLATTGIGGAERKTLIAAGKEIAKGSFKEGVEELAQSAQEQIFTNLAMDKPWNEGVPEAAAQGMVAGVGQGGGMILASEIGNRVVKPAEGPQAPAAAIQAEPAPPAAPAAPQAAPTAEPPITSRAPMVVTQPEPAAAAQAPSIDDLKAKVGSLKRFVIEDDGPATAAPTAEAPATAQNNASGQTDVSLEAISDQKKLKAAKIKTIIIDTRSGKERPAIGPRPEDNTLNPFDAVVRVHPDGRREVTNQGAKAKPLPVSVPVAPAAPVIKKQEVVDVRGNLEADTDSGERGGIPPVLAGKTDLAAAEAPPVAGDKAPPAVTAPAPVAAVDEAPAATAGASLRPAIRDGNDTITGEAGRTHAGILDANPDISDKHEKGYVDADGEFLTVDEAGKQTGPTAPPVDIGQRTTKPVKIMTVYGDIYHVDADELAGDKNALRLYNSKGDRLTGKSVSIVRGNIAPEIDATKIQERKNHDRLRILETKAQKKQLTTDELDEAKRLQVELGYRKEPPQADTPELPESKIAEPLIIDKGGESKISGAGTSAPTAPPRASTINPRAMEKFNAAYEAKDAQALKDILHLENKGLRAEFEQRTGTKLKRTVRETGAAVDVWVGGTVPAEVKKYGRSGNAIFKKDLAETGIPNDPENSDYRDFEYFFEKYYNAGAAGKGMPTADMHAGRARAFYEAGKTDASKSPRDGYGSGKNASDKLQPAENTPTYKAAEKGPKAWSQVARIKDGVINITAKLNVRPHELYPDTPDHSFTIPLEDWEKAAKSTGPYHAQLITMEKYSPLDDIEAVHGRIREAQIRAVNAAMKKMVSEGVSQETVDLKAEGDGLPTRAEIRQAMEETGLEPAKTGRRDAPMTWAVAEPQEGGIINQEESSNDNPGNGSTSQDTLENRQPEALQEDGEKRGPGKRGERSGGTDSPGDESQPADRDDSPRGVASEQGTVHPDGPGEELPAGGVEEIPTPASEPKPLNRTGDNPGNYRITEETQLGQGTRGQKINNNLEAIRIIKALDTENRYPTLDEQHTLARYVGWGGLKSVFDTSSKKPQDQAAHKELERLLTKEELFDARQSVLNAHYTSKEIIDSMYGIIRHFGFAGGHIIEPTYGAGNFIGLMPESMTGTSKWYGSELDPITAKIGQYLYPEAQLVNSGFQEAEFPYNKFDMSIGNPPFGDERITDNNKKRSEINRFKIHNYVIAKAGMHLKPGGIMPMVVTTRFLDTANPEARDYLAKHFKLLTAVRLPNDAFTKTAGTEVTTDMVFFQKLMPGEKPNLEADWLTTGREMVNSKGETVKLNAFFAERPHLMLGEPTMQGTMYGGNREEFALVSKPGQDTTELLRTLPGKHLADLKDILVNNASNQADAIATTIEMNREDVGIGGYYTDGKDIFMRNDDDAAGNPAFEKLSPETLWSDKAPTIKSTIEAITEYEEAKAAHNYPKMEEQRELFETLSKNFDVGKAPGKGKKKPALQEAIEHALKNPLEMTKAIPELQSALRRGMLGAGRLDRIKKMLNLRALTYELITAERFDQANIEDLRQKLNTAYDNFVGDYGYISSEANSSLMSDDIKIEFGLEQGFTKPISAARAKTLGVKPQDAKAKKAAILQQRVFFPEKEITSAESPKDGYEISLSEKARLDLPYISELTGLPIEEVISELANEGLIYKDPVDEKWLQEDDYLSGNVKAKYRAVEGRAGYEKNAEALKKILPKDLPPEKIFVDMGATWVPTEVYSDFLEILGVPEAKVNVQHQTGTVTVVSHGPEFTSELGVLLKNDDYSITDLFNLVANKKAVIAYDHTSDGREVNKKRTQELAPKVARLKDTFKDWIFADPTRTKNITTLFNETQNTDVERRSDGSHLHLVGNSPSIKLRDTQKNAAWRGIQTPVILLDHVVGAGKTFTIAAITNTRKRLGLSRKSQIIVPNHLVGQWAREYMQIFPGAHILAATEKDFASKNRKRLFSRIATGNHEVVIMGHSALSFIPLEAETERRFIQEEVKYLEKAMEEAREAGDKKTVRTLTNRIAKKMERIKSLMDKKKDDVITFENMGFDYMVIDEAHEFKNLEYSTSMQNVTGMGNPNGAKKSFDLYSKIQYLRGKDGGVCFATGTPISNSLVEMYTILRYLNNEGLKGRNIDAFDSWVRMFASVEPKIEYTSSLKLKERQVMASFNNLQSMLQLYKKFADVISMADLKRIYTEQIRRQNKEDGTNEREEFPVPKVKHGGRQLDVADATPEQRQYMDYLVARAERLERAGRQNDPKIDNALWVMTDARKMALDIRLVDQNGTDHPDNKINRAKAWILNRLAETKADSGTILVFCDLSTPAKAAGAEARAFIGRALERLKLKKDARTKDMLDGLSYQDQWHILKTRIETEIDRLTQSSSDENDSMREALEKFLEDISPSDEAVLTTVDSGFSVYDELKKKLIESGVPDSEVRFIHEANSQDKKKELFDQVNAGQVRVMIGSSKKMGAGTNVQQRAVGLYHMDAPWRPSDVEQREGRVIRQGNSLYERGPEGFEIDIAAASTRSTFDAVMWQILDRKQGMLDQFRSGVDSFDEESTDTASYADFMAESTGNQIFKEKLALEKEISYMESEQRSVSARRASSERTIKNASKDIEKAQEEATRTEKELDGANDADHFIYKGKSYPDDLQPVMDKQGEEYSEAAKIYNEAYTKYWEERKDAIEASDEYKEISRQLENNEIDDKAAGRLVTNLKNKYDRANKDIKPVTPEKPSLATNARESKAAKMAQDIQHEMLMMDESGEVTLSLGTAEIKIIKNKDGEKAAEIAMTLNGRRLGYTQTSEAPTESQLLDIVRGSDVKHALSIRNKNAKENLAERKTAVKEAHLIINKVKFEKDGELNAMKERYKSVQAEVTELEEEMAEKRANETNRYIERDTARFPNGAEGRGGAPVFRLKPEKHGEINPHNWLVKLLKKMGEPTVVTDSNLKGKPVFEITLNPDIFDDFVAEAENRGFRLEPHDEKRPDVSIFRYDPKAPQAEADQITFDMLGFQQSYEALAKMTRASREALPHLAAIGKQAYQEGRQQYKAWSRRMKELLGDMWTRFSSMMETVWSKVKQIVGNERGAVGRDIREAARRERELKIQYNRFLDKALEAVDRNDVAAAERWLAKLEETEAMLKPASGPVIIQEVGDGLRPEGTGALGSDSGEEATQRTGTSQKPDGIDPAGVQSEVPASGKDTPPSNQPGGVRDVDGPPSTDQRTQGADRNVSSLAAQVEADAIRAKLTQDFGELASYETMNMQDQADRAQLVMDDDYSAAVRMAMGEEPPPAGIREATMFEAVKIRAIGDGDVELLRRLATESTIPARLSEYGQAIKAADSRLLDDPVKVMQDLIEARAERLKKTKSKPTDLVEIERLQKELDAATEALNTKTADLAIKQEVKKEAAAAVKRKAKREVTKGALDTEFHELSKLLSNILNPNKLNAGIDPDAIPVLMAMAKNRIQAGIVSANGVIDSIYQEVRDVIDGIRKRDIRDALSNYGKTRTLSQDEIDVTLRELKRQWMMVSKIEDVGHGKLPELTGLKHDPKSDEVRRLEVELRQIMKKTGLDNLAGNADHMKTALDAVKTRLKNDITDLNRQIHDRKRDPVRKTGVKYDEEAMHLREIRDSKRKALDLIDARPGITAQRKAEIIINSLERSIEEYKRQIATGDLTRQVLQKPLETPEIKRLRDERDSLHKQRNEKRALKEDMERAGVPDEDPLITAMEKFMADTERRIKAKEKALDKALEERQRQITEKDLARKQKKPSTTPDTPAIARKKAVLANLEETLKQMRKDAKPLKTEEEIEASKLKSYKTRLANEIKKLEQTMKDGNFTVQEKRPSVKLDQEGKRLKLNQLRAKENLRAAIDALGTITKYEAAEIVRLSQIVADAREAIGTGGDRLEYGAARVAYENYVNGLKGVNAPVRVLLQRRGQEFRATWSENKMRALIDASRDTLSTITNNSIAMVASLDNSFLGRQGLVTLMTHPTVWYPAAKQSFVDFAKTIGGKNAHDALLADLYSRPNYLNGEYQKAGILAKTEEQYPTSLPQRVPGLGRVFKASEVAFNGTAIRMRTGLYDMLSENARDLGVDMDDKVQAESVGKLINSMTARGKWGQTGEPAIVRLVLWAPKMLKGNIDVLTAHSLGGGLDSDFARKEAWKNLIKVVGITAILLTIAKALQPDSVEEDPRSTDFGKIKIGSTRFDITGGKAAIITLVARLLPVLWGHAATKSTTTGLVTKLGSGYGQKTALDVFLEFIKNKTAPPARVIVNLMEHRNRDGEPFTWTDAAYRSFTPISLQNAIEMGDDVTPDKIAGSLVDLIGINANSYGDGSTQRRDIVSRLRRGKSLNQAQQDAFDMMDPDKQKRIEKDAGHSAMANAASKMDISDLAELMESGDGDVVEQIRPAFRRKYIREAGKLPEDERARYKQIMEDSRQEE